MTRQIYHSTYKNISALTMETDCLKVQFTPEYGGKMLSLIDKRTAREFLRQGEGTDYRILNYDGDYVSAECSGFDDMFPTIDKAVYPFHPWKGVEMPDHGEVCGLNWDYCIDKDSVYMAVHGVRFPYKLEKWVGFSGGSTLCIRYMATNLSRFDMDFLWAAHVMLDAGNGGEIIVPYKDAKEARLVFTSDEKLGGYGDTIIWPSAIDTDGNERALNIVGRTEERIEALKVYLKERLPEGLCAFRYAEDGTLLTLSFPENTVPYLGIVVSRNHGIILEPCTGTMDRPDIAGLFGQGSILPANGQYSWHLNFTVEHP